MHKPDDKNRPSVKELREWAADLRRKYHSGELPQWQIEELNKTPGWTWDIDEADRLGQ